MGWGSEVHDLGEPASCFGGTAAQCRGNASLVAEKHMFVLVPERADFFNQGGGQPKKTKILKFESDQQKSRKPVATLFVFYTLGLSVP